ncbi:AMP-binding protein [Rhizohabitans arisaemae]|uniref:AMP-binding protein n=1 Tax=Rhizohabitans arisaemae TaxID=2720610 RepID=UPI0024B1593F|nr:AMP-binding protein [Rhizohabitans arisaemae]
MAEAVGFGTRITLIARSSPDRPALTFAPVAGPESVYTWAELDAESNRAARLLASHGAGPGTTVVVALRNGPAHFLVSIGAWKAGAMVLPLKPSLTPREQAAFLDLVRPVIVAADEWEGAPGTVFLGTPQLTATGHLDAGGLPPIVPHPGKAVASGGSTGRPKVIVDPRPWTHRPGEVVGVGSPLGFRHGQTQLVAGALSHNAPFCWAHFGLCEEHHLVLTDRFDPAHSLRLIERHRVGFLFMAPVMMQRVMKLPGVEHADLSSVETLFHTAAPCPPWLKRAWIERLGPDRVIERFGASEAVGNTRITGGEWLTRPGSVGRGENTRIRILDDRGADVPVGEVGEIFMRALHTDEPTYEYLGAEPATTTPDGYTSVGDMGWLDADGYLYLADRRPDMINIGGVNVYPAEVEAVLSEHPAVGDVAVVGLPDEEYGQRVHAVVKLAASVEAGAAELIAFCRERLSAEKVPRGVEFRDRLPRDEAGKLRRRGLVPVAHAEGAESSVPPDLVEGPLKENR